MAYFDYAATTPLHKRAQEAMQKTSTDFSGNPSSLHNEGITARKHLNGLKTTIASLLNAERKNIIMTSSGTEANNLAIKGSYFKTPNKRIITSTIEHHATENPVKFLAKQGADVQFIPVDTEGFIDIETLKQTLSNDTALVSIIYANNEIGTIQSIEPIRTLCKQFGVKIHLDMVQAPMHETIDFKALDVEFISISAHKFGGPRGVGCLLIKDLESIEPLIHGGKQEFSLRAGTENLAGVAGFSAALEVSIKNMDRHNEHVKKLAKRFLEGLDQTTIDYRLNGPSLEGNRLANVLNIGFKNENAEMLSFQLNQHDIYVSLGSACDSDNIEPSHVLKAIDVPDAFINGSLRFSFGDDNTEADIDYAVHVLQSIIEQ